MHGQASIGSIGNLSRWWMAPIRTVGSSLLIAIFLTSLSRNFSLASCLVPTVSSLDESSSDLHSLLCLKLHLSDHVGVLSSWQNDSVEYCSWYGVACSKSHADRVTALNLDSVGLDGQIPPCIGNLTFLTSIHLPNNQLEGDIPFELGNLHRLSYLNLSSNKLNGVIPNSLSSCSRLKIIDLGNNSLHGEIPTSLKNCSDLEEILLDHNMLQGSIPEGLGTLTKLSILSLAKNSLTGNIPLSLGSSSSLTAVILKNNSLTGGVPPLLANSSSLQWLDLVNNRLNGEIPPSLFNSTSLQIIALADNKLVGHLPSFSQITTSPLQYLILTGNDLSGAIPSFTGNFSLLERLLLSQNNFQGSIPASLGWMADLQILDLTYNNLSGTVPVSLYNMSSLIYLGLGTNYLEGDLPGNIGYTLKSTQTLIMQGNQFQGKIPTSLANATNLQVMNLRNNSFSGNIPFLGSLPNLIELNLGMNQLDAGDWSFLNTLANCTQLVRLYLDANNLRGILPSSIANISKSLEHLFLNENQLSGNIPREIEQLTSLTLLFMDKNLFTGNLPHSLGNLVNLFVLSLSENKLSGQIPPSIGNLGQLSELDLQQNKLTGSIPGSLGQCKTLGMLNLSCNSFDGSIPKELFEISTLSEGLDLSHNQLSGPVPQEIGDLINLDVLDISNNRLSGPIPTTLGKSIHLESLHMEGNLLDGTIPESFKSLRGVTVIDLSTNNLSGEIPDFFESLSSLKLLNLSFNNLEGPVPTSGVFQNASEVFIQGNKKLCSSSSLLGLPPCNTLASKRRRTSYCAKIVGLVALAVVSLSCFAGLLLKKRRKAMQPCHQSSKEFKKLSYADLEKATNGFSSDNLVGSGKYGSVYEGRFESEMHAVAIKVFKLDQFGAPKSFVAECEALRNTRHRNLVKVITACLTFDPMGHEFKALILEFMSNGSLESWLHPNVPTYGSERTLSLGSRIVIAVDMACALDYLHNHCIPPMVHCDLKPSNVLLDDDMGAHVSDFGLAKFLHGCNTSLISSSTSVAGPRGSVGYIAPEYAFGSKISTEGDVYGYGVIILEMLTGKRPTDDMFNNGLNLHKFVEKAFPHKIFEILDPKIAADYEDEHDGLTNLDHENRAVVGMLSCVTRLVKLGLSCSVETPKDRPTMQFVCAEVTTIKQAFSALPG